MPTHLILSRTAVLGALLITAACDVETDALLGSGPSGPELEPAQAAVVDAGQPVLAFADGSQWGTSKLVRTPNGVSYRLSTSGLEPGHAYTLWFVVFNDPSGCAAPTAVSACSGPDVVNPDAVPDMAYAAGNVVGNSGRATFAGSQRVGALEGSVNAPVLPAALANGLVNPLGAEIHLVVHHHGPKLPEYMPDMIQSIDGGCTDAGVPAAGAPSPWNDYAGAPEGPYGRRGPNICASLQFAVHQP